MCNNFTALNLTQRKLLLKIYTAGLINHSKTLRVTNNHLEEGGSVEELAGYLPCFFFLIYLEPLVEGPDLSVLLT